MNNGSGSFSKVDLPVTPAPDFPTGFLYSTYKGFLADINGDGTKDVVQSFAGQQNLGAMRKRFFNAFVNNGSAVFTKSIVRQPFLGIPADINGDGKAEEVVFVNSTSGTLRFSGTNETAVIVRTGVCTQPTAAPQTKLVDFGGDGISDIVLWRPSNGDWQYVSNLVEGTFNWGLGSHGDIPALGDFDADGKSDFSVFRNSTGAWYVFRSSDATWFAAHFGLTGDMPVQADYNGDGKTDIAVFRPVEGNWYIWFTGTQQYLFTHWGLNGDRPVPNDYDGDGKTDLAVFRPSEGNWYYLRSTNGGFRAINWGLASDTPVPADYDMDGLADIAVFRPDNAVWYIYRSYDGGINYSPFGQNGDIPMAVDSDGDGIIEQGVYRSTGYWFAGSQPAFNWGLYGTGTPVRLMLPNN